MGMGRWPYGYYRMGLRKGKRRMGIPEGVPEMMDESSEPLHISEDSSSRKTTGGHDKGAVQEQEAQPGGGSFVEEEAANKRQKVRAALVDAVAAPALDLPALQRQSLFALAMLIAARSSPPSPSLFQMQTSTLDQQPLLAPTPQWFLGDDAWGMLIAARPLPPSGRQPLLAPKPWFLDQEGWQFLHDASRPQIRALGTALGTKSL